eukprot:138782_1
MAMQVEGVTPGAINENEIGEDNECRNPTDDQSERQQHYASSVSDVIQNDFTIHPQLYNAKYSAIRPLTRTHPGDRPGPQLERILKENGLYDDLH